MDAAGSYCADAGGIAGYQWREDGAPIPGATLISYTIPSSQPAGAFDYSVEISCSGGATDESAAVQVSVVPPPGLVGATLTVGRSAGDLVFNWADVAGADEYAVYSSTDPSTATFTGLVGISPSGTTGLTAPLPSSDLVYYLVAGRNAVCGEGPQR